MAAEAGVLKVVSSDARRNISEFEFDACAFQDFTIHDGSKPLGNHFHRDKFEVFYFLDGGGKIFVRELDTNGKTSGITKEYEVKPGFVIRIPPFHAHRFDLDHGTRFVAFSSKPFDLGDLNPHQIEG